MTTLRTIELHGDRVAYRDEGAGEVLLLIHGMGGNSNNWRPMIPMLAKKYRVIAPDLLGHGQTAKPRGDYSLGAFAVWLRDLLDTLGIPRVTIVGHSLGGGIAMQFAHQHPDYCERLILISSGGLGNEVNRTLRLASLPGSGVLLQLASARPVIKVRMAVAALGNRSDLSHHWEAHAALANRENRQAFLRTLRAVVDGSGQAVCALTRLHSNADRPVLIITGDQDPVIPVDHAYAAHRAMPHSRLRIIPGAAHHPHTEHAETVARLITEFISSQEEHREAAVSLADWSAAQRAGSEHAAPRVSRQRTRRHLQAVPTPDESLCG
ncbi:alpha/beta fold hydrolase [Mycobacterium camsae]|uniref:alpha/beta fold hydrolase n=1 Tax=Mycobacterium gordonae TaxID=1778 RepID=UPI0019802518|nr:alpha/beta fold hydrolase [Mycobacterium gordonae]